MFWLFLVEEIVGEKIKRRWPQQKSPKLYCLDQGHDIFVNNLVAIGTDANMVYVLPKYYLINKYYSLVPAIEKMLMRVSSMN